MALGLEKIRDLTRTEIFLRCFWKVTLGYGMVCPLKGYGSGLEMAAPYRKTGCGLGPGGLKFPVAKNLDLKCVRTFL